jgi:hypothetical protein
MARELALMIGVKPSGPRTDAAELEQARQRLAGSGYPLRSDPSLTAMAEQRADHMSCVDALAEHLGKPTTVLVRQS